MSFSSFLLHHFSSLGYSFDLFCGHIFLAHFHCLWRSYSVPYSLCSYHNFVWVWPQYFHNVHFYLNIIFLNFEKEAWFRVAFLTSRSSLFGCFWVVLEKMAACLLRFPGSLPLLIFTGTFSLFLILWSLFYLILIPSQQFLINTCNLGWGGLAGQLHVYRVWTVSSCQTLPQSPCTHPEWTGRNLPVSAAIFKLPPSYASQ